MQIDVQNVWKTYRRGEQDLHVLRGVTEQFAIGAFHFIVGPSGSGKSSLLYLLGALDQPTSGQILVDGRPIQTWSERERNRFRREEVGFIFQNFNLMSNLSALDNVLVPYLPVGISAAQRQQARDLLSRLGLSERLTHQPNQLSGGEQQRVAIARALLKRPRFILADEPTGELDSQTGRQIIQTLRELSRENGATVIVVTHDTSHMQPADIVHRIADCVIASTTGPASPTQDSQHA